MGKGYSCIYCAHFVYTVNILWDQSLTPDWRGASCTEICSQCPLNSWQNYQGSCWTVQETVPWPHSTMWEFLLYKKKSTEWKPTTTLPSDWFVLGLMITSFLSPLTWVLVSLLPSCYSQVFIYLFVFIGFIILLKMRLISAYCEIIWFKVDQEGAV